MTQFRHKCPPDVNPKTRDRVLNGAYAAHIQTLYDVADDAVWQPVFDTGDARFLKMGVPEQTGREMAFVVCPDCGAEIVVTRSEE